MLWIDNKGIRISPVQDEPNFSDNMITPIHICTAAGFNVTVDGLVTAEPISLLRSLELKDPEDGVTTFVVHTWMMDDLDFEEYEKLFSEHRNRFINYDELFKIPPVRRSRGAHYAEYTAAKLKRFAGSIM